jgi:hypothetical protein
VSEDPGRVLPGPIEPPCDTTLAVDEALSGDERQLFTAVVLVGRYQGAEPADWIADAANADAFLDMVEPWWDRFGQACVAQIVDRYDLPPGVAKRLVGAALYAGIATNIIHGGNYLLIHVADVYVLDLAGRAALRARQAIDASGWVAPPPAGD